MVRDIMTSPPVDVQNQVAYCGVTCGTCGQGSGKAAKTAKQILELINEIEVKEWAPSVPGGAELDWTSTERTLKWMTKNTNCKGCERGGGSPDCAIRVCAKEKGFSLCNECDELESCTKFDYLGDKSVSLKERLVENKGKTKEQIVSKARATARVKKS
jgi:hypothetical protein